MFNLQRFTTEIIRNGETIGSYEDITSAYEEAQDNDTLKLTENETLSKETHLDGKSFTLDLNGKELSTNDGILVDPTFTLIDSGSDGRLVFPCTYGLYGQNTDGTIIINGGTVVGLFQESNLLSAMVCYTGVIGHVTNLIINGGTIKHEACSENYSINGKALVDATNIQVNGGTLISYGETVFRANTTGDIEIVEGYLSARTTADATSDRNTARIADAFYIANGSEVDEENSVHSKNGMGKDLTFEYSTLIVRKATPKPPVFSSDKTSLVYTAVDPNGKKFNKTFTGINNANDNSSLKQFAQKANALTQNTYSNSWRIDKTDLDKE